MEAEFFNKLTDVEQASGYCPGPRAYPVAISGAADQRNFLGIRNMGQADGRPANNANNNNAVRGGLAPENWPALPANHDGQGAPAVDHQTWFKMINPTL